MFAFAGLLPWALIFLPGLAQESHLLLKNLCHQMPERSLAFFGEPMAVCSRCAGIYAGIALGAIMPAPGFLTRLGSKALWIALSIALLDVIIQNYLLRSMIHGCRISTGAIAGWAACAYMFASMAKPGGEPK
jgi:uncharacterized membrane protein